ncbi:MAG: FtsW/RodA/SpoVE family cell cycle protein, partial [Lachnospiraceae bacterium]|nr:FtsW/RodA/SpoVE family cell cycle protein [Lachnospiraceae bacterium]
QKLGHIPEIQNDMIFAVVCEELGIFGVILMLALFTFIIYRMVVIARNAPDLYGALIVTGVIAHISLQVILNLSVVLNLIPTTGISLPFFSYGGTSMLFTLAEIGLVLSVSKRIRLKGREEDFTEEIIREEDFTVEYL